MPELVFNFVDAILWAAFLMIFHGTRRRGGLPLGFFATVLALVINIEITGHDNLYSNYTLPIDIVILCSYAFVYLQEKWWQKLFSILLYNICVFGCNTASFSFLTKILQISAERLLDERSWARLGYLIFAKLLLFSCILIIIRFKEKIKEAYIKTPMIFVLPVLGVAIISLLMQMLETLHELQVSIQWILCLMSLISLLFAICFRMLFEVMKVWEQNLQNQILKQQLHMQEDMYEWQRKNLRQVSRLQHDLKHRLVVVEQLLYEQNYEHAQQYLQEYLLDMEKVGRLDCRESVWKTLVAMKRERAQASGIVCNTDIREHGLKKIDVIDICVLLGNLLDNAIEAQEQLEQCREIHFVLREEQMILIEVKNRIREGQSVGELKTTKADADKHGFGVVSIKEIVKKYHGICHYKQEKGWFVVEIFL